MSTSNDLRDDLADLPQHARERLADMKQKKLFTSDLSVNEFLLLREAGFEPLGLVMGSSLYQVSPTIPSIPRGQPGVELKELSNALGHARQLAMNRMEEEAAALGADGIVGVRLTVNLSLNPQRLEYQQFREWNGWAKRQGFRRPPGLQQTGWFQGWQQLAKQQWTKWTTQQGWTWVPVPPWVQPRGQASYSLGTNTAEFIALGTAVRHRGDGAPFRNQAGKPFQSDLSGQDFWLLIRSGYRPVGFVMGNCVYYVPPALLQAPAAKSVELTEYTHALYDARELAIERLQDDAEALGATGVVGVTVSESGHSWRAAPWNIGNAALQTGELIELFVIGTAVVPTGSPNELPDAQLVFSANDVVPAQAEGGEE